MTNEEKVYPSKKGFIIYAVLGLLVIMEISYFYNGIYLPAAFLVVLTGVVVFPLLNTRYIIKGDGTLNVRCGFFVNIDVPIADIKSLTPCRSIISAPALSFDRVEIFYGKYDSVIISPENQKEFIAQLQTLNPAIECTVNCD